MSDTTIIIPKKGEAYELISVPGCRNMEGLLIEIINDRPSTRGHDACVEVKVIKHNGMAAEGVGFTYDKALYSFRQDTVKKVDIQLGIL